MYTWRERGVISLQRVDRKRRVCLHWLRISGAVAPKTHERGGNTISSSPASDFLAMSYNLEMKDYYVNDREKKPWEKPQRHHISSHLNPKPVLTLWVQLVYHTDSKTDVGVWGWCSTDTAPGSVLRQGMLLVHLFREWDYIKSIWAGVYRKPTGYGHQITCLSRLL